MNRFWQQLSEQFKDHHPGATGAVIGLLLALSLVIFGLFRTLFILLMTGLGYFLGSRYFSDRETIRGWLDKLLPPGKFR